MAKGKVIAGRYIPYPPTKFGKVIAGHYYPSSWIKHGKVICGKYTAKKFNPNIIIS